MLCKSILNHIDTFRVNKIDLKPLNTFFFLRHVFTITDLYLSITSTMRFKLFLMSVVFKIYANWQQFFF